MNHMGPVYSRKVSSVRSRQALGVGRQNFLPWNGNISVRVKYKKEDESFKNHHCLDSNLKWSSGWQNAPQEEERRNDNVHGNQSRVREFAAHGQCKIRPFQNATDGHQYLFLPYGTHSTVHYWHDTHWFPSGSQRGFCGKLIRCGITIEFNW